MWDKKAFEIVSGWDVKRVGEICFDRIVANDKLVLYPMIVNR